MARFLLIHGAAHGAWCWDRLVPLLAAEGHAATAIDLPGHGTDTIPTQDLRLADYADAVLAALRPGTFLVGHSFGGFPITLAAARHPDRVAALVYLAALVPQPGLTFRDLAPTAINPDLTAAHDTDPGTGTSRVLPEAADFFYSDCAPETRAEAMARVTPEPIAPLKEPAEFAPPALPRHYIRCLADRVVLPAYQQTVSADWPDTHDMETGHSPFLSDPDGLATRLDRIAKDTT